MSVRPLCPIRERRRDPPRGRGIRAADLGEWHDFAYEFQAKDLAAENSFQLNVGDQAGTVWVADFTVTKRANETP
jgi:hypothetical protein